VLIDCCMPTCTCRHTKLSKTSFFLGQILNFKTSFFFWNGGVHTIDWLGRILSVPPHLKFCHTSRVSGDRFVHPPVAKEDYIDPHGVCSSPIHCHCWWRCSSSGGSTVSIGDAYVRFTSMLERDRFLFGAPCQPWSVSYPLCEAWWGCKILDLFTWTQKFGLCWCATPLMVVP
jgi:hypothetical protein